MNEVFDSWAHLEALQGAHWHLAGNILTQGPICQGGAKDAQQRNFLIFALNKQQEAKEQQCCLELTLMLWKARGYPHSAPRAERGFLAVNKEIRYSIQDSCEDCGSGLAHSKTCYIGTWLRGV